MGSDKKAEKAPEAAPTDGEIDRVMNNAGLVSPTAPSAPAVGPAAPAPSADRARGRATGRASTPI
jgi:hypothetical protein